jgi:hypothetical protein
VNQQAERPVAISLRLYHALANAFPQEFKNAYGDELLVTAENAVEDIWRRYGVAGLVRLLADIAVRVPIEHLAEVRRDIRYGLRMLLRSPGFTAVSLISLTLGICIATCADSEMNGVIFRNVPGTSDPDELVSLELPVSYPNYKRYRELRDVFSSTAAYVAPVPFAVSLDGRTDRIWDTWFRLRTSRRWAYGQCWAVPLIRRTSSRAQPALSLPVIAFGKNASGRISPRLGKRCD